MNEGMDKLLKSIDGLKVVIDRRLIEARGYKRVFSHPDHEEMWEDPAGHVMTFDTAVKLEKGAI